VCWSRGLIVAIPKDAARKRIRKHGRRLKGPELVTARAFNPCKSFRRYRVLQLQSSNKNYSAIKLWLRLPREIGIEPTSGHGRFGQGKKRTHPANLVAESRSAVRRPIVYDRRTARRLRALLSLLLRAVISSLTH